MGDKSFLLPMALMMDEDGPWDEEEEYEEYEEYDEGDHMYRTPYRRSGNNNSTSLVSSILQLQGAKKLSQAADTYQSVAVDPQLKTFVTEVKNFAENVKTVGLIEAVSDGGNGLIALALV